MCKLISTLLVIVCYIEYNYASTAVQPNNPSIFYSGTPSMRSTSSSRIVSRSIPPSTNNKPDTSQFGNLYVGCFKPDDEYIFSNLIYRFNVDINTVGICFSWCVKLRRDFAAISGSTPGNSLCFCGFNLTVNANREDYSKCSSHCGDLPGFTCGGDGGIISVYNIIKLFPPGEVSAFSEQGGDDVTPGMNVLLLISQTGRVQLYNSTDMEDPHPKVVAQTEEHHSVDYDYKRNLMYMSLESAVYQGTLITRRTSALLTIPIQMGKCLDFAVDWVHKRLYWVDCSGTSYTLKYKDLTNEGNITTVRTGLEEYPISNIEVDPYYGILFWIKGSKSIESCRTDTADLNQILYHPGLLLELALDMPNKKVFYFGSKEPKNTLYSVDYTGSTPELYFKTPRIGEPCGLGVVRGFVYWISNGASYALFKAPIYHNYSYTPVKLLKQFKQRPWSMRIVDPDLQTESEPCSVGNSSCLGYVGTAEIDNPPNTNETDSSTECILPGDPVNKLFCPYQCTECSINPYSSCAYPSRTENIQAIKVQCLPGYGLATGQDQIITLCIDKTWVPSLPDCQKVCPPLESEFLDITCFNEFSEVDCKKPMRVGIRATYKCKPSHREFPSLALASIYKRVLVCRNDGHWTSYLPECEPICGVSRGNDTLTPSIVNGTAAKLGQFPWHTALYKRNSLNKEEWENICGGSLITHRIVLSAAHCVAGITTTADLQVALGKYYRDWAKDEKDEKDTIRREVVSIKIPPEYKGGVTSYTWDVALLLMNASVQFNSFVMPVCMNLRSQNHLTSGNSGYVVGWGETASGGDESDVLLFNTITIMAENDCQRSISLFLSFDKFCGIRNDVSVVQPGDSGGGLTAIVGGLHYIFGIVSTKSKEIPMFTNISWESHKRWIDREIINIIV